MPPSDDDTDPISSQTKAPPDDKSSERRSSAEAPTDLGPRARMNTVKGLGEAPADLKYKRPGDYSAEELSEIMDAFVRAPRQFRPIKTAVSNGLLAASYAAQPHAVHGGVDTLPPDEGVIVSIPEEITQPPARRPQDNTTVDLPPIATGLDRRGAQIVIALVAALLMVIGVGLVMRTQFQTTTVATLTASSATAVSSRPAPTETTSAAPSAEPVAGSASTPSSEPSASSAPPPPIRRSTTSQPRPRPTAEQSTKDSAGGATSAPWIQSQ